MLTDTKIGWQTLNSLCCMHCKLQHQLLIELTTEQECLLPNSKPAFNYNLHAV